MKGQSAMEHSFDGDTHTVQAVLNVLVKPSESGGFFAQGLEIDYVATGATEEIARRNFARGFIATISACLSRGKSLESLFSKSKTPASAWSEYFSGTNRAVFGCVVQEDVSRELSRDAHAVPNILAFHHAVASHQ